jgi:hypothetical protein
MKQFREKLNKVKEKDELDASREIDVPIDNEDDSCEEDYLFVGYND